MPEPSSTRSRTLEARGARAAATAAAAAAAVAMAVAAAAASGSTAIAIDKRTHDSRTRTLLTIALISLIVCDLSHQQQVSAARTPASTTANNKHQIQNETSAPNSTFQANYKSPVAQRNQRPESTGGDAAFVATNSEIGQHFHAGAKVAIALLAALILLVASATLVDIHQSATATGEASSAECDHYQDFQRPHSQCLKGHSSGSQERGHQQQHTSGGSTTLVGNGQIQRSHSLSSSCSSSLFCSANSVASASAPILGTSKSHKRTANTSAASHHHHRQQRVHQPKSRPGHKRLYSPWHRLTAGRSEAQQQQQQPGKRYQINIQMLLGYLQADKQQVEVSDQQQQHASSSVSVELQQQQERVESVLKSRREAAAAAAAMAGMQHSAFEAEQSGGFYSQPVACAEEISSSSSASSSSSENPSTLLESSKWFSKQTMIELFLAFSIRQSAALIFQDSNTQTHHESRTSPRQLYCVKQSTSPSVYRRANHNSSASSNNNNNKSSLNNISGHRSRVSSLSSINEINSSSFVDGHESDINRSSSDLEENPIVCGRLTSSASSNSDKQHPQQHQQQQHHQQHQPQFNYQRPQSIESLHGLRFLSMIWVIVIHSYNFALRWLFFTNTSSLDNLYKTTASQLLANGSFACDSFFFAGGFLLPYLTFPLYNAVYSNNNSNRNKQHTSADVTRANGQNHSDPKTTGGPSNTGSAYDSRQTASPLGSHLDCLSPSMQAPQVHVVNSAEEQQQVSGCGADNYWSRTQNSNHRQQQQQQHHEQHQHPRHQNISVNNTSQKCAQQQRMLLHTNESNEFTFNSVLGNILHRYIRMMPLMMAIIGLSATLLRYLGEGPAWEDSTLMYDKWCRKNWWINALFLHNFLNRQNMCLSHSWYSAVDIQLFLLGQLILFVLFRSRKLGLLLCCAFLFASQLITGILTLVHHLPAVPLIASVNEETMNLYYGEIYIKPYCRASPYLIGILQAYLMRTTSLGQAQLKRWQLATGWTLSIGTFLAILLAMQPAMNGQTPSELQSALYSALSRPLWACATGWMIFACMTKQGGIIQDILSARCFAPLSRLTYPAFLIHPIVMAVFYGSRQSSFHFSHYLMLYLILGNIVITYASAFVLSALFELPLLSAERVLKKAWRRRSKSFMRMSSSSDTTKPAPAPTGSSNHKLLEQERRRNKDKIDA